MYSARKILLGRMVALPVTLMHRNVLPSPSWINELPYGDKVAEKMLPFYGMVIILMK